MRDRERGDLTDASLELLVGADRRKRSERAVIVESQVDVMPHLVGSLAHDELSRHGALSPVHVTRVVPIAHRTDRVGLLAEAATDRADVAGCLAPSAPWQTDRIDCRVDD